jgi:hypothetical protein
MKLIEAMAVSDEDALKLNDKDFTSHVKRNGLAKGKWKIEKANSFSTTSTGWSTTIGDKDIRLIVAIHSPKDRKGRVNYEKLEIFIDILDRKSYGVDHIAFNKFSKEKDYKEITLKKLKKMFGITTMIR